jgi:hypothetical protein
MGAEIQGNVTIGPGIIIGDVFAIPAIFTTEDGLNIFRTEDNNELVTEYFN